MRKRRTLLLLIAAVVCVGVILAVLSREREREPEEPRYGGKKLSEWVLEYADYSSPNANPAHIDGAIRDIGTNAIPFLLDWIRYEPPLMKPDRAAQKRALLARMHLLPRQPEARCILGDWAVVALTRLALQTDDCIAELGRLLNDPKADYGAAHGAEALMRFGQAGVPALLGGLTNGPGHGRGFILRRIGSMGTNAAAAIPSLQVLLTDVDRNTRVRATNALRRIDPEALESAAQ